ncbi:MAG: hypothetical protein V4773_05385 [Verrucomicrobiota bacterium]
MQAQQREEVSLEKDPVRDGENRFDFPSDEFLLGLAQPACQGGIRETDGPCFVELDDPTRGLIEG